MLDSIVNSITTVVSAVLNACGSVIATLPAAAGVMFGFLGFVGTLLLWLVALVVYLTAVFTLGAVIALIQNRKNNILYAAFVIVDVCVTGILLIALIMGLGRNYDLLTLAVQAGLFFIALIATMLLLNRNEMMPQTPPKKEEPAQSKLVVITKDGEVPLEGIRTTPDRYSTLFLHE